MAFLLIQIIPPLSFFLHPKASAPSPMAQKQLFSAKPTFHLPVHSKLVHVALVPHEQAIGRRTAAAAALAAVLQVKEAVLLQLSSSNIASAFDFSLTAPDQTLEEADAVVRTHARDLLQIKRFIDRESWREAQVALRESSSYLKQDLYTIIQAKPGSRRPQLRKLYSVLFNNASMLDYAARDKDASRVHECYDNIVKTLNEIFAAI